MLSNDIKKGAYILLTSNKYAIVKDNRNGIHRMVHIAGDRHAHYILADEIVSVYLTEKGENVAPGTYAGKWHKVTLTPKHKKEIEK